MRDLTYEYLSLLVGLNSEGTLSLGVLMPIAQSINVHITTDRNTAKSANVPRTCPFNNVSQRTFYLVLFHCAVTTAVSHRRK